MKDKFKSFNNDFDELVKSHQQWAMPSVSVKKEIRGLVKDKVVPTYASFSDKWVTEQLFVCITSSLGFFRSLTEMCLNGRKNWVDLVRMSEKVH